MAKSLILACVQMSPISSVSRTRVQGGENSHVKVTGVLVGKLEFNP